MQEFQEISDKILAVELRHHAVVQTEERLNFGLLEVVYEWARNKVCYLICFKVKNLGKYLVCFSLLPKL